MQYFAERLRDLRIEKDLSREQLAIQLEVSPSVIRYWEQNKKDPSITNAVKTAKFFNVSLDYICGISD